MRLASEIAGGRGQSELDAETAFRELHTHEIERETQASESAEKERDKTDTNKHKSVAEMFSEKRASVANTLSGNQCTVTAIDPATSVLEEG